MPVLPRASTFDLASGDAKRLIALLAADEDRVRDALRDSTFGGAICALALATTAEHQIPTASYLAAWTDAARSRG